MSAPTKPVPALWQQVLAFMALTALFALLHHIGTALYYHSRELTTVKPYGGVALALILILGQRWLWPVLAAGMLGGILAKLMAAAPLDSVLGAPSVTSLTLLVVYLAVRRLVGERPDFRDTRQLVGFIATSTLVGGASACLHILVMNITKNGPFWFNWEVWFIPTTLSFVIFTPVIVLLATAERRVLIGNWRRLSGCLLLMATVLSLNFLPTRLPLFFTTPMALLVVALICGLEGTALGLVLAELILTGATAMGYGAATIDYLPLDYQLNFIQIFMAIQIAVMLPVAAAIDERMRLRDAMAQALEREAQANIALRSSEQHARDIAEQALAANKAKSEFLASMSHELRTPLNAILGFSEILKTELFGPVGHPKYLEYADDVHRSGAHLLDLINDVLDLSKIDAGKMDLRESIFSVRDLVNDTLLLVRDKARNHVAIRLVLDEPAELLADKRLIKQILLNLLSNAIKFTPAGGTITLAAGERHDGRFEISVADTGIGMNQAQIEKAFSHYGQIDSKIARAHQGTGLGLPISLSLARLHGGDLVTTSTPGEGTCITLILPESRLVRVAPRGLRSAG